MSKRTLILASGTLMVVAILVTLFWTTGPAWASREVQAGAPGLITYQGYLVDGAGSPVANGNHDLKFELCTTSACATIPWTETQAGVSVQGGYFSVILGSVTSLNAAHFDGVERWLRVSAKGPSDASYTAFPAQRITAAPYALQAEEAKNARFGVQWSGSSAGNGFTVVQSGSGTAIVANSNGTGSGISGVSSGAVGTHGLSGLPSGYSPTGHIGVWGDSDLYGVVGTTGSNNAAGVYGIAEPSSGNTYGVLGWSKSEDGAGAYGLGNEGIGVFGQSVSGPGGYFDSINSHALVADGANLNAGRTPRQIATLHWYEAIEPGPTVTVGSIPQGLAFDGDHVWVADYLGSVTKVRASDGKVDGPYSLNGSCSPESIAFDGLNMWVPCSNNSLDIIRTSDGSLVKTVVVDSSLALSDIAFDGTYMWVTSNIGPDVIRINASNPVISDTYTLSGYAGVGSIAFDGAHMWVVLPFSNQVAKVWASDGALVGVYNVGPGPKDIAFDGANMWIVNQTDSTVTCLRASDGVHLRTVNVGNVPWEIAFDGGFVWVTNWADDTVTKIRASDGLVMGDYATGSGPIGVTFDGSHVWTADSGAGTLSKH